MDFNSLSIGQPVYCVKMTKDGLKYFESSVKDRVKPILATQPITFTVTIDGIDETFTDVPGNLNIVEKNKNLIVSLSEEGLMSHIKALVDSSKKALQQVDQHNLVIKSGEVILAEHDHTFAEERKQAQLIDSIQQHQKDTDERISNIEAQNSEILKLLKKLNKSENKD